MEPIMFSIALSGDAFYSLYMKGKYFSNPAFDNLSTIGMLLLGFFIIHAFANYEWFVPVIAVVLFGGLARGLRSLIYSFSPDLGTTSIMEIIFIIASIVIFFMS